MDKWSKKKASETCGGIGMSRYIDCNEARRLDRLKSIKSSIGSKTSHSGWQKQQIEKRRKEQLRQRKKDAKKKQLGDGIRVDTKVSKTDAVSKCGLKLKIASGAANDTAKERRAKGAESQIQLEADLRMCRRACGSDRSKVADESKLPLLGDRSNVSNNAAPGRPKQSAQGHGANQRFRPDEGKENSDNSTNKEPVIAAATSGRAVPKKQGSTTSKKYFTMDINSLRREHADAIKLLEELDQCEGNRRRSLDSDNSSYDSASFGSFPNYKARNTLDDDFVKDCSARDGDGEEVAGEGHAVSESFLNMSHLSISLQDDFDGDGRGASLTPKKNRSFTMGGDEGDEGAPLTPNRNRSFTSSCASVEEGDFFGDADVESGTSEDDGYSSGTLS